MQGDHLQLTQDPRKNWKHRTFTGFVLKACSPTRYYSQSVFVQVEDCYAPSRDGFALLVWFSPKGTYCLTFVRLKIRVVWFKRIAGSE